MNNDNSNIDFVIPLHRYHNMVRTVVEAIHLFYNPRTIYIITPEIDVEEINEKSKNWMQNKVIAIKEETFFMKNYGLSRTNIENLFNQTPDEQSREFGWWYQQLIKLGANKQIEGLSNPYIVWDSDLIPLNKWEIYPTNREPEYKFAILQEKARSQWNVEQYRSSLYELTKLPLVSPQPDGTFVPHHYVLHHKILEEIHSLIQNKNPNNKSWIHSIMNLSHRYYRFSEYLMISSFMMKNYPELLKYHPFNEFGKTGFRIRDSNEFVKDVETNCKIEENGLSYQEFYHYVENQYKNQELPSYLQIEHI
jgi:hypothetical protein